uniref:Ellis van Creveld protein 2 like protein n=1 Tax=Myoviridae sp. ctJ2i1 TaxID=2825079 RepID=A0A8S5V1X4_9CAUD|nr:MAG TPA: Ellis van Creveld protein 2 like protein [Myoviridae sp. ctJ2i1]
MNEVIIGLNKAREDCASVYKMLAFQLGFVISFIITLLILINR